ncbi:MAG TPA: porin family protein [Rhodanobacter sp.]
MKKTVLALTLAAAGFVAVPAAFAQDQAPAAANAQQGWYVSADAGYANVSKGSYDDGKFAGGVKGGYRFAITPATSLGVEVGYQWLGRLSAQSQYADQIAGNSKSKLRGSTAGVDLRYSFNPNWYGELRGGLFYAQGEGITSGANPEFRQYNRTKYYAGAGVGYNLSQNWSLGANYDYYAGSDNGEQRVQLATSKYSLSAEYRF